METKLHIVLSAWKNFNVVGTQEMLDGIATDIAEKQTESENSRKKLVEQLKEFKGNATEETKTYTAPLIKSFQSEVDCLSNKCKFSDAAFLKCYKKFLDIVDPVPSLEYSKIMKKKVSSLSDLEIENKSLQLIIDDYKKEFKDIKYQDMTIKNLKDKINNLESEIDISVDYNIKDIEKRILAEFNEKEKLITSERDDLVQKFDELEKQKNALQHSFDQMQSEFFDMKSNADDKNDGHSDEVEILLSDIERSHLFTSTLKKEIHTLKNKLIRKDGELCQADNLVDKDEISDIENKLKNKEMEIGILISNIKMVERKLNEDSEDSQKKISNLEESLCVRENTISKLESQMKNQTDYEEMKRELNVIKCVEFGFVLDDSQSGVSKPLELLLLEKNKQLQSENMSYKLSIADLAEVVETAEMKNQELSEINSVQLNLIKQLEQDVLNLNSVTNNEESKSQAHLLSEALQMSTYEQLPDSSELNHWPSGFSDLKSTSDNSILPIITSQRERFKKRNAELENDLINKNNQIIGLKGEIETLKSDNIKLYEKIRYLRSYKQTTVPMETNTEYHYSNQYESNLDPFSTFSLRERQRKYQSLGPFEKITLFFGRFILQNKAARTGALIYFVFVHCLIFFTLYLMAHTEAWKKDISTKCTENFKAHMHNIHGDDDFSL